jgi:hypothetical protein
MTNKFLENVKFMYMGMEIPNQKYIHVEIARLNLGNACYCLFQNLLSFWFASKET